MRVQDMVEPCREQLHEQQAAPPYVPIGLSLGGMVVAAWASARPEDLAGCVLVNASMRPFSPTRQRLRPPHWPALLGMLVSRDPWHVEQTILRLTSSQPGRHSALLANWNSIRRLRPVAPRNALRQLLAAARFRFDGPAPMVPTLVISSAGDRLVDPACSQALAQNWGSEHIIHPYAGHDLALDDGHWLANHLVDWMHRRLVGNASTPTGRNKIEANR